MLRVEVTLDLGLHVVIGVGRLTVQFHHAYAIPNTKFFSSGCCSPIVSRHRQLNLYPKFLHISHRENGSVEVLSLHFSCHSPSNVRISSFSFPGSDMAWWCEAPASMLGTIRSRSSSSSLICENECVCGWLNDFCSSALTLEPTCVRWMSDQVGTTAEDKYVTTGRIKQG